MPKDKPDMSEFKVDAVFQGEAFWTRLDTERAEHAGPAAIVKLLKSASHQFIQFCDASSVCGDAFNESLIPPTQPAHVECYFGVDPAFWTAFDEQRAEYAGPGAQLRLLSKGHERFIQFCDENGIGGDPLDDSFVCPGSPRC